MAKIPVSKLEKNYQYKSKLLIKAQVHIKFPHIIIKRKSFDNPLAFFVHSFRIKGDYEHRIKTLKTIVRFMEALQEGKVDFDAPISYFPLFVLESRWLMKYVNQKLVLKTKGLLWLEAMKETIELYGDLDEIKRPK